MSTAAVLKRPAVAKTASGRVGAREKLERAFTYGNALAKKHGFTEEDVNNEIEAYRKEKAENESCYRR